MELRHLRYFVAVAEEQNVTHAALRLHISQPALSRQIRDLENELATELFVRGANTVRLTDAGRSFLQDCQAILHRVDEAFDKVKRGKRERVRVGYAASPTTEILHRALKRFQELHPHVEVTLHDLTSQGILNGVRENKIDIALTVAVAPSGFAGLTVEQIGAYEVRAAFAKGHRFEKLRKVPLSELSNEPLVTWSKAQHPEAHLALKKILHPYTDAPKIAMECDSAASLIAAVESGKGMALVFRTLSHVAGKRIVLRPVTPAVPLLPIAMIYNKESLTDVGEKFVSSVRAVQPKPVKAPKAVLVV